LTHAPVGVRRTVMTEKIIAIVALASLIAFLGVLIGFVPEVDLTIVILLVCAMACYDFFLTLFGKRPNK
jgi:hypothetical protein